jgi:PII-like signaling protein
VVSDLAVLSAFFGERQRVGGRLLAEVAVDGLAGRGVSGSVLLRAIGGFGLEHHLRGDETLTMSEDPTLVLTAIDAPAVVEPLRDDLVARHPRGVVTVERARDRVDPGPGTVRASVLIDRHERVDGVRAHVEACDVLHRHGVAGASVLLGVDGTVAGVRERARFFGRNVGVPILVESVGDRDRLAPALAELQHRLRRTTVAVRPVRVCKRDGVPVEPLSGAGWQRLTVYTSESQLHEHEPVHRAIVRRLRAQPSRGVTVLRGIRGFHGDHLPHGDVAFRVGRRVPVLTTVVDTADRIAAAYAVVDELTPTRGLVTVEDLTAVHHPGR